MNKTGTMKADAVFEGGEMYSKEEKAIQGLAGKLGGRGLAAVAAYAAMGQDKDPKMLRKLQKEFGLTSDQLEEMEKTYKGLDKDVQKTLGKMVREGGDEAMTKIAQWGDIKGMQADQAAIQSEGFKSLIGGVSKGAADYLSTTGDVVSMESMLENVSDEEIDKMMKSKDSRKRRLASTLRKAKGEGKGAERAKRQLHAMAIQEADISVEGTEDTEASSTGGKQAKKLDDAEAAMAAMQDVATSFQPAVKEFRKGTKQLLEAMEYEQRTRDAE